MSDKCCDNCGYFDSCSHPGSCMNENFKHWKPENISYQIGYAKAQADERGRVIKEIDKNIEIYSNPHVLKGFNDTTNTYWKGVIYGLHRSKEIVNGGSDADNQDDIDPELRLPSGEIKKSSHEKE